MGVCRIKEMECLKLILDLEIGLSQIDARLLGSVTRTRPLAHPGSRKCQKGR
jgi:hypothetical protein